MLMRMHLDLSTQKHPEGEGFVSTIAKSEVLRSRAADARSMAAKAQTEHLVLSLRLVASSFERLADQEDGLAEKQRRGRLPTS